MVTSCCTVKCQTVSHSPDQIQALQRFSDAELFSLSIEAMLCVTKRDLARLTNEGSVLKLAPSYFLFTNTPHHVTVTLFFSNLCYTTVKMETPLLAYWQSQYKLSERSFIHWCINTHTHTYIHAYINDKYKHACINANLLINTHTFTRTYMYEYMHTYEDIHEHTYIRNV